MKEGIEVFKVGENVIVIVECKDFEIFDVRGIFVLKIYLI